MRNIIRTALVIGTLATPMIAMADDPKTPPAKTDAKDAKDAKDTKAPAKKDAKAPAKKDTKDAKDAKDPAAK